MISQTLTPRCFCAAVQATLPQRRVDKFKEAFRKLRLENKEKNRVRPKRFGRY